MLFGKRLGKRPPQDRSNTFMKRHGCTSGTDFQTAVQIWDRLQSEQFLVPQQNAALETGNGHNLRPGTSMASRKLAKKSSKRGKIELLANR